MITWQNFQELLGDLTAMFLVFSGLWFGFSGPAFRYLMRRVAQGRKDAS